MNIVFVGFALQLNGEWSLGQQVCDMWTSLDVMLCTASILNLCAISIDRYFVITHPLQYATKRTPLRMAMMIVAVWALSALISVPALVVWKASPVEGQCYLSQDLGYTYRKATKTNGYFRLLPRERVA